MKKRKIKSKQRKIIKFKEKTKEFLDLPLLEELTRDLDINIRFLKERLRNCSDIIYRYLEEQENWLIYTNGLVDENLLTEGILKILLEQGEFTETSNLPMGQVSIASKTIDIIDKILTGHIVLLFKNKPQAIVINLQNLKVGNRSFRNRTFHERAKRKFYRKLGYQSCFSWKENSPS